MKSMVLLMLGTGITLIGIYVLNRQAVIAGTAITCVGIASVAVDLYRRRQDHDLLHVDIGPLIPDEDDIKAIRARRDTTLDTEIARLKFLEHLGRPQDQTESKGAQDARDR